MALKTTDIDKGEKKLRKKMRQLDRSFTTIGIHKNAGKYPSGESVVRVAAWNEFGTSNAPARPFLRSAIDTNRQKIDQKNLEEFRRVSDCRSTPKQALDRLGFFIQTLIVNRIDTSNDWAEPNAPSTAARKRGGGALRGPTPLIQSGLLRRSVTFKTKVRR